MNRLKSKLDQTARPVLQGRLYRDSLTASLLLKVGFTLLMICAVWLRASAQIKVNPDGVNVNSQGSTVVFLTFGPVTDHIAAEVAGVAN